jgi:hypothetical protein
MTIRPQIAKLITVTSLMALSTACSSFTDVSTSGNVTDTVFDRAFPDALEEVFATCSDPLRLEPGDDTVDLTDGCNYATDVSSTNGQLIAALLMTQGTVDLAEPISGDVGSMDFTIDGFPWPLQNCEVDIEADINFEGIRLFDLQADWVTHDGSPSLRIDFDFNGTQTLASVDIDATANCPSGFNEWLIQKRLDKHLNGSRNVNASGLDLDVWVMFDEENDSVVSDLDVEFDVGSVDIAGVNWDKLYTDPSDVEDEARDELQSQAQSIFEDALSELPEIALDLLFNGIDEDAPVCDLDVSGGEFTVSTGTTGRFGCMRRVIARIKRFR